MRKTLKKIIKKIKRSKNEETEDKKEKYKLSKFTNGLFWFVIITSTIIQNTMATAILFCFLFISTTFDILCQEKERKKRGEK